MFDVFVGDDESTYRDQVKIYQIKRVYQNGIDYEKSRRWTRQQFSEWYRRINKEALLCVPKG
jgi:hypothetical protein